ncbi:hypothetical protein ACB092_05G107400 [Castanea dentata]
MATRGSRSEKVKRIFQQFDVNRDGGLNREEMAALVVAVNPRVKFSDEQINAILNLEEAKGISEASSSSIADERALGLESQKKQRIAAWAISPNHGIVFDDLFDSLPDDLVISILCKLSLSDLFNVRLTCRRLNGLVLNSLKQPDCRQKIVNKIMETLKRRFPVSCQEGLCRKIAIRFEEKIYTAATSPSDYLQEISLKMSSLDYSTAQTGHANGADWPEKVYQKIKTLEDLYLPEISEMYQEIAAKLQKHDSLPQQSNLDHLEKLKVFKTMLERIITFLQISEVNISPGYKEKLGSYEKQIVNFVSTTWPKKPALQ